MTQDKTQPAVNGYSLNKGCNAGLGHLWASLRAGSVILITGVFNQIECGAIPARNA
jgi:hypothetical protein